MGGRSFDRGTAGDWGANSQPVFVKRREYPSFRAHTMVISTTQFDAPVCPPQVCRFNLLPLRHAVGAPPPLAGEAFFFSATQNNAPMKGGTVFRPLSTLVDWGQLPARVGLGLAKMEKITKKFFFHLKIFSAAVSNFRWFCLAQFSFFW